MTVLTVQSLINILYKHDLQIPQTCFLHNQLICAFINKSNANTTITPTVTPSAETGPINRDNISQSTNTPKLNPIIITPKKKLNIPYINLSTLLPAGPYCTLLLWYDLLLVPLCGEGLSVPDLDFLSVLWLVNLFWCWALIGLELIESGNVLLHIRDEDLLTAQIKPLTIRPITEETTASDDLTGWCLTV